MAKLPLPNYPEGMPSSTANTVIRSRQTPASVRIVNWPLRDDGVWSWLQVVVLAAIAAFCGVVSANSGLGFLSFVALALSAWRMWVPVAFTFNSRGITQIVLRRQRRISWPQVAGYTVYPGGMLLKAADTPLAPLRGLYVRWNGHRDELLEMVSFFIDRRPAAEVSTQTAEPVEPRQSDATSAPG